MFLNMEYDFKYGMGLMIRPFYYYTPQHIVHIYIRALDKREHSIILFLIIETICCDPSSEPSQSDGSDEGSQYTSVYSTRWFR